MRPTGSKVGIQERRVTVGGSGAMRVPGPVERNTVHAKASQPCSGQSLGRRPGASGGYHHVQNPVKRPASRTVAAPVRLPVARAQGHVVSLQPAQAHRDRPALCPVCGPRYPHLTCQLSGSASRRAVRVTRLPCSALGLTRHALDEMLLHERIEQQHRQCGHQ